MYKEEEKVLFALEEQFEKAAKDASLSTFVRMLKMQEALRQIQTVVLDGFRVSPRLGHHLAELALDYLEREDLAQDTVVQAFEIEQDVESLHGHLTQGTLAHTVKTIQRHTAPSLWTLSR